jgi:hypothetical protein
MLWSREVHMTRLLNLKQIYCPYSMYKGHRRYLLGTIMSTSYGIRGTLISEYGGGLGVETHQTMSGRRVSGFQHKSI